MKKSNTLSALLLATLALADSHAEVLPQLEAYQVAPGWLTTIEPVQVSDHVWQVGTAGITSLLVKTDAGAVLVDGGMAQAADAVLANLQKLGVAPQDVRYILHSHAHGDHAGALAALKRATGATLVSNAESCVLLERGGNFDIHFGNTLAYPPVHAEKLLQDEETLRLGSTTFQVWFTPGHTPGSMSWTWNDTQSGKPISLAYVDSLSAPGYKLLHNPAYPNILQDFQRSFATVRKLPCDLLLTPHPDRSGWNYTDPGNAHQKPMSCVEYADGARQAIDSQVAQAREAKN